jgi:hypothetical protein
MTLQPNPGLLNVSTTATVTNNQCVFTIGVVEFDTWTQAGDATNPAPNIMHFTVSNAAGVPAWPWNDYLRVINN